MDSWMNPHQHAHHVVDTRRPGIMANLEIQAGDLLPLIHAALEPSGSPVLARADRSDTAAAKDAAHAAWQERVRVSAAELAAARKQAHDQRGG
eukprot:SAG11_NODE_3079_length_2709_cov_1.445594_1_plen_93_part_00